MEASADSELLPRLERAVAFGGESLDYIDSAHIAGRLTGSDGEYALLRVLAAARRDGEPAEAGRGGLGPIYAYL